MLTESYMAIGSESGSISSQTLEQLRQKVQQTQTTLETEDPEQIATLDREDLLGDLFHAGMLGYYAQYTALGNLMGLQADGQMMLLAGMGTFGYEPKVNRLFGFPRSISPGGVALNIPIAGVQVTDGLDREEIARFNQQIGLLSSALEHATPEQMFSTDEQPADAISAVKALSKANAEGQRIYELTPDNMVETLPNLNLAIETEAEIQTALNAGLTVIAHTDNVSVPGWMGAGYIIFDPETGGGAYKISGGLSGGIIIAAAALGTALFVGGIFLLVVATTIVPLLIGLFALILGGVLIGISLQGIFAGEESLDDFVQGVGGGLALITLLALVATFPIVGAIQIFFASLALVGAFLFILQQIIQFGFQNISSHIFRLALKMSLMRVHT